jgi:transposase InsO family protein
VKLYPFIAAEKAERRNVRKACDLLEVSRSAYYRSGTDVPSARELADTDLLVKIEAVHELSKGTYGSPRVHAQLLADGEACGQNRVARLMQHAGIVGREKRRFRTTTLADPDATPTAIDLLRRSFGPDTIDIDRAWVGDITYVRTWEGWLYLATVIDLGSRRVVGWAMADHMRTELVSGALRMALGDRRPGPGLIFHSDRGCQYTSKAFGEVLDANQIVQSLSRPGQCWDNAVAESFFATLKGELIYRHPWPTRAAARAAIFEFIQGWYNTRRLHSSLGYRSPAAFEAAKRVAETRCA